MNDSSIARLLSRYPAVRELIAACRKLLSAAFPGSSETADQGAGLLAYSYGPGYKNMLATIILGRKSVKIGIPYGAAFEDPSGLLKGTGKVHKHIVVESLQDLDQPAVSELLAASRSAWQTRAATAITRDGRRSQTDA